MATPAPRNKKTTAASTTKPQRAHKRVKAGQALISQQASTPTKLTKKATTKKTTPAKKKIAVKKKAIPQSSNPENNSPKGCLEAAVTVLSKSEKPMGCKALMDAILEQKFWSTQGATPHQTLSSAIQREINKKGKESRFVKTGRGLYDLKKASA